MFIRTILLAIVFATHAFASVPVDVEAISCVSVQGEKQAVRFIVHQTLDLERKLLLAPGIDAAGKLILVYKGEEILFPVGRSADYPLLTLYSDQNPPTENDIHIDIDESSKSETAPDLRPADLSAMVKLKSGVIDYVASKMACKWITIQVLAEPLF